METLNNYFNPVKTFHNIVVNDDYTEENMGTIRKILNKWQKRNDMFKDYYEYLINKIINFNEDLSGVNEYGFPWEYEKLRKYCEILKIMLETGNVPENDSEMVKDEISICYNKLKQKQRQPQQQYPPQPRGQQQQPRGQPRGQQQYPVQQQYTEQEQQTWSDYLWPSHIIDEIIRRNEYTEEDITTIAKLAKEHNNNTVIFTSLFYKSRDIIKNFTNNPNNGWDYVKLFNCVKILKILINTKNTLAVNDATARAADSLVLDEFYKALPEQYQQQKQQWQQQQHSESQQPQQSTNQTSKVSRLGGRSRVMKSRRYKKGKKSKARKSRKQRK